MKIRFDPPVIPEDGFSEGDTFERKQVAETLISLGRSIEGEMTLLLDGPWGTGKTVFLRQFEKYAATEGFPVIYLDVFRHDLSGDAFSVIGGQILKTLEETSSVNKKIKDKFLQAASVAGNLAIKGAVKVGVAALTGGFLNEKVIQGVIDGKTASKATSKGLGELLESSGEELVSNMLKNYSKADTTLASFQSALHQAAEQLQSSEVGDEGKNPHRRLFFVIDELDRCRPDFALEILECVKHFYQSSNVIFLLSADIPQMLKTVRHAYGSELDSERYLEKFYDLRLRLPLNLDTYRPSIARYSDYLSRQMPEDKQGGRYKQSSLELLVLLAEKYDISLRSFEKICQIIMIVLAHTHKGHFRLAPAVVTLCYCSVIHPEIYKKMRRGTLSWIEFSELFQSVLADREKERKFDWMLGCIECLLIKDVELMSDEAKAWASSQEMWHISQGDNALGMMARELLDVFVLPE